MKKIKLTDFNEDFAKRLKNNPKELKEYKSYIFSEFEKDQNKDLLLLGLKTIALATDGMTKTSTKSQVKLRSLYKMLDKDANPTFDSLIKILKSMNLKMKIA